MVKYKELNKDNVSEKGFKNKKPKAKSDFRLFWCNKVKRKMEELVSRDTKKVPPIQTKSTVLRNYRWWKTRKSYYLIQQNQIWSGTRSNQKINIMRKHLQLNK